MGSIGNFAEEFWNVEAGDFGGWEIVNQRVKEASKVTTSCVDFLKQLGAVLDGFGRNLLKVAKNSSLPDSEHGELRTSLSAARAGVEAWGEDCVGAGVAVTQQAASLAQHLAQARLARRRCTQLLKPRQQQVKESVRKVQQAQRQAQCCRYSQCCQTEQSRVRELVNAQAFKMTLEEGKKDTTQREREKASYAGSRAEEGVKEAEGQHREAVTTHNSALDAWCTSASSAFNTMQESEEARLEVTREVMWGLANICSLLALHIDQQQDTLRTSLLRVDVGGEVAAWVETYRTQQTQPVPLMYTPASQLATPLTTPSATPADTPSVRSTITEASDSDESSEGSSPVSLRKARALYQFSPKSGSEVSLLGGETVTVMEGSSAEWCLVKTPAGHLGFVPGNFISAPTTKASATTTSSSTTTAFSPTTTNKTTDTTTTKTTSSSFKWFK